ncbi:MAG TPA: hypothetical protein VNU97_08120 [Rhizomicrobium sp.]|jgi:hypothetical protein|nr:hypothetical protein [Rhizomicrobium sp.]
MRHSSAFALASSILFLVTATPASAQAVPTVAIVQTATHPAPPPGWKVACMPNAVNGGASPTCPVLQFNGYTYWAWSDDQNGMAMAIVAYDANGVAVKQWNKSGARYVWNVTVDTTAQTVAFVGQANNQAVFSWSDLFIPAVSGALTFVNVGAPAINCVFNIACTVTVTDSLGAISLEPGVSGTAQLQTRTFMGAAGAPGAGLTSYEYRVDMTGASSDGEVPCVTDLAVDFGAVSRLSFDGTGQAYDVYVVTQGAVGTVGLFSVTKTGNVVDFVFNQPVCAGHSGGAGLSSDFIGIASAFVPKTVTANLGWPGTLGLAVAARAPAHPGTLMSVVPKKPVPLKKKPAAKPPHKPVKPH